MPSSRVPTDPLVALVLSARLRDVGGGHVRRTLPHARQRSVGPFVFFDHFGPAVIPAGVRMDVRPHPHIGLSTVTYLLEGRMVHRDSLGSVQQVTPGAINWMTAGRGIVHSERTPDDLTDVPKTAHGLQLWAALPRELEDCEPRFDHHPAASLPELHLDGVTGRLLVGEAFGARSPVEAPTPTLFAQLAVQPGVTIRLPEADERAVYVMQGDVRVGHTELAAHEMAVLTGGDVDLHTEDGALVALIGGAPLDGPRVIWWNFVASDPARIDRAAQRWKDRGFDPVPGDDEEYIPLPDA